MEVQAAAADHHAAAAGARAAGREDLHRQGTHRRVRDFEVRIEKIGLQAMYVQVNSGGRVSWLG